MVIHTDRGERVAPRARSAQGGRIGKMKAPLFPQVEELAAGRQEASDALILFCLFLLMYGMLPALLYEHAVYTKGKQKKLHRKSTISF